MGGAWWSIWNCKNAVIRSISWRTWTKLSYQ